MVIIGVRFLTLILKKFGGFFLFQCNYDLKFLDLEGLPLFYRNILTVWQILHSKVPLSVNEILLQEKFLQFDWLRAVVFQLNLKYLHVKITNLLRVVV